MLGIDAVDIYGLSEVIGPGVAQECVETKDGLHVWEDHFYPEVVDPVTGEVLPDGERGELVFTSLTKQAMPVIRYRTRDLTRLLPGTARTMRRMEKVTGRTDDMIILRGVNLFPTQIEELLLTVPALSPHFQCVLTRTGTLDEMTVRVERRGDVSQYDGGQAGHDLERLVKATIGVSVAVDVVSPDGIERSVGKMRRIVDQRQPALTQRRRVAPQMPTPMPTTAPPRPTSFCDASSGRARPGRRAGPRRPRRRRRGTSLGCRARAAPRGRAVRRSGRLGSPSSAAAAGRGDRLLLVAPHPVGADRVDQERDAGREPDGAGGERGLVDADGHAPIQAVQRNVASTDAIEVRVGRGVLLHEHEVQADVAAVALGGDDVVLLRVLRDRVVEVERRDAAQVDVGQPLHVGAARERLDGALGERVETRRRR